MLLKTENLSFGFNKKKVLNKVCFTAYKNQLISIIGANGAGKTTLFNCLLNNYAYTGNIWYDDKNVNTMDIKSLSKMISYIPQATSAHHSYRVIDMVLMGLTNSLSFFAVPKKEHVKKAQESLKMVGLLELQNREFRSLSGGEQQLCLIARSLTQASKILLLDECTSNLDYGNQIRVLKKLRALADSGFLVIFSTHNPHHALGYSDKALALIDSELFCFKNPSSSLNKEILERIYKLNLNLYEIIKKDNSKIKICIEE